MPDHAVSDDPRVQRQLDRLATLSPGADVLGLERISALLARLGNPERRLPPVFHVAGTNGKGSTCAFLRAAVEAAGLSAHVYTSPHLVRFNERIRIAGTLIDDALLAELLEEVLDAGNDIEPSFFEATTAAAFLAFARIPADVCIIEVGLGGRLDATNVIPAPAVCGIAQLGVDHQAFLGDSAEAIAAEKAGIAKPDVPLVTQLYPEAIARVIGTSAAAAGAKWLPRGRAWDVSIDDRLRYRDRHGALDLPLPALHGPHQAMNAALAVAMLRHQDAITIPDRALREAMTTADWPARLQRLSQGPLRDLLPRGAELWLDGGHNPAAAQAIADHFGSRAQGPGRAFHIIIGMLENKDAQGVLAPFAGLAPTVHTLPVHGHAHHSPAALAELARGMALSAAPAADVETALARIEDEGPLVLILGSLYLAGTVLAKNGQPPV